MLVCSPNLVVDAEFFERIQWLAMRLVKGFRRVLYEERLRRLGLYFLSRRSLRKDLIATYYVIIVLYPITLFISGY